MGPGGLVILDTDVQWRGNEIMEFFLPEGSDQGFHLLAEQAKERGHRAIHSFKYKHEGSRYVVTIGASRREYKRKTGPRGGAIKDLRVVQGESTGRESRSTHY